MRVFFPVLLFAIFISVSAQAALTLPRNLTTGDRKSMLQVLGFGSQSKLLSSPVPLGGYEGFEFGISSEYIPIEDLSGLGSKTSAKGEFNYLALSFGKGLAHNVDTFFHFTPQPQSEGIFSYGGHLRWGFYEVKNFPGVFSFVLHGSGSNFVSLLSTRTTGADLIMTVAMSDFALYFGGGTIRTIGTFTGGAGGITKEGYNTDEDLTDSHTVFGLSLSFEKVFFAFEVDRVTQSTYAGRLGYRF